MSSDATEPRAKASSSSAPPAVAHWPSIALWAGWVGIGLIRAAERHLPSPILRAVLSPLVAAMVLRNWAVTRRRMPMSLRARWRLKSAMVVRLWPDRLRERRWQARCRAVGWDRLESVLASGRPVILASLHYGSPDELYPWLRARGVAVGAMSSWHLDRSRELQDRLAIYADEANGLVGVPRLFGNDTDQLFEARDFLASPGRVLLMLVDTTTAIGRRAVPVVIDGVLVNVRTGVFKLAAITDAVVVPCLLVPTAGMGCELHVGLPVPDAWIGERARHPE